jgi:hypothetical protein
MKKFGAMRFAYWHPTLHFALRELDSRFVALDERVG